VAACQAQIVTWPALNNTIVSRPFTESLAMTDRPFVHLHCHSHYSLLDGANRIPELVERTKSLGMNALALTDHGDLYGAIHSFPNSV